MYKKLTIDGQVKAIIREFDSASIPLTEVNTDYKQYLEWVAEGNEAEEWNPGGIE